MSVTLKFVKGACLGTYRDPNNVGRDKVPKHTVYVDRLLHIASKTKPLAMEKPGPEFSIDHEELSTIRKVVIAGPEAEETNIGPFGPCVNDPSLHALVNDRPRKGKKDLVAIDVYGGTFSYVYIPVPLIKSGDILQRLGVDNVPLIENMKKIEQQLGVTLAEIPPRRVLEMPDLITRASKLNLETLKELDDKSPLTVAEIEQLVKPFGWLQVDFPTDGSTPPVTVKLYSDLAGKNLVGEETVQDGQDFDIVGYVMFEYEKGALDGEAVPLTADQAYSLHLEYKVFPLRKNAGTKYERRRSNDPTYYIIFRVLQTGGDTGGGTPRTP